MRRTLLLLAALALAAAQDEVELTPEPASLETKPAPAIKTKAPPAAPAPLKKAPPPLKKAHEKAEGAEESAPAAASSEGETAEKEAAPVAAAEADPVGRAEESAPAATASESESAPVVQQSLPQAMGPQKDWAANYQEVSVPLSLRAQDRAPPTPPVARPGTGEPHMAVQGPARCHGGVQGGGASPARGVRAGRPADHLPPVARELVPGPRVLERQPGAQRLLLLRLPGVLWPGRHVPLPRVRRLQRRRVVVSVSLCCCVCVHVSAHTRTSSGRVPSLCRLLAGLSGATGSRCRTVSHLS
jgi:hypothetical protein